MNICKCKYCKYESTKKAVREHIRKNHYWKGSQLKSSYTVRELK